MAVFQAVLTLIFQQAGRVLNAARPNPCAESYSVKLPLSMLVIVLIESPPVNVSLPGESEKIAVSPECRATPWLV